jgi:hypothetical protein
MNMSSLNNMNRPSEINMAAKSVKGKTKGIKMKAIPAKKPATLSIPWGYKFGFV